MDKTQMLKIASAAAAQAAMQVVEAMFANEVANVNSAVAVLPEPVNNDSVIEDSEDSELSTDTIEETELEVSVLPTALPVDLFDVELPPRSEPVRCLKAGGRNRAYLQRDPVEFEDDVEDLPPAALVFEAAIDEAVAAAAETAQQPDHKKHARRGGHRNKPKPKPQMTWDPQLNSNTASRSELLQPLLMLQQLKEDRLMVFFRHANRHKRNGRGMVGNSLFIVVRKQGGRVQYVTRSIWNDDSQVICPDIVGSHWFDLTATPGKHEFVQYDTVVDGFFVEPPYQYLSIAGDYYIAAADDHVELEATSEAQLMGSRVPVTQRVLKSTVLAAKLNISPVVDFRQRREIQALDYIELAYRLPKAMDHITGPIVVDSAAYQQVGRFPLVTVFAGLPTEEVDLGTLTLRFKS